MSYLLTLLTLPSDFEVCASVTSEPAEFGCELAVVSGPALPSCASAEGKELLREDYYLQGPPVSLL